MVSRKTTTSISSRASEVSDKSDAERAFIHFVNFLSRARFPNPIDWVDLPEDVQDTVAVVVEAIQHDVRVHVRQRRRKRRVLVCPNKCTSLAVGVFVGVDGLLRCEACEEILDV